MLARLRPLPFGPHDPLIVIDVDLLVDVVAGKVHIMCNFLYSEIVMKSASRLSVHLCD